MKKTVCIVTLSDNADSEALSLIKKVACSIGSGSLIKTADAAEFSAAVAAAKTNIVFASADIDKFLKAKFFTIKALSCGVSRSTALLAAMGTNAPADPKEKELQAAIPNGANCYPTLDGLYSAFTFKRPDGSLLIFLPLDTLKLRELFATGLGIFKVKAQETKPAKSDYRNDVESFISAGKSAAIAEYGYSKVLYQVLSKFENSEYAFNLYPAPSKDPDSAARAARNAALYTGLNYGIAISSLLTDPETQEKYIEVCVSDTNRAEVAKVYAESGEDTKSLASAAVIKLCSMLNSVVQGIILNPEPKKEIPQPKPVQKKSLVPLLLAVSGVCAATVISLIIALTD